MMMKTMLMGAMMLASAAAAPKWDELEGYTFEKYVSDFQKAYDSDAHREESEKMFYQRLAVTMAHNEDASQTWKRGINHMSDWSDEDRKAVRGVKKQMTHNKKKLQAPEHFSEEELAAMIMDLPTHVDWRDHGVISPVKDQGRCGSCWSFAATETIESYWALKTGEMKTLSEQHVLDCVTNPHKCGGTGGCDGGIAELAFDYFKDNGGISSEWTYPYTSYFGDKFNCRFNATTTKPEATVTDRVNLPTNRYEPLLNAVATKGPMAITVDASSWHDYESGVFTGCNPNSVDLDHAVQLVGYGTDGGKYGDYWLVRNSWDTQWGEDGYIRIHRNAFSELCGQDHNPMDGDACEGETNPILVCGTCGIWYDATYPVV